MGAIGGTILLLYAVIPPVVGVTIQFMARKKDKEAYGTFPGLALISHSLVMLFLVLGCYLYNVGLAVTGLVGMCVKIGLQWGFQKEIKAFTNMRDAAETNAFLLSLRQRTPAAHIFIKCWHTKTVVTRDSDGNVHTKQETVVTFTQTRYLQVTGFYDTTPPLYVRILKDLIYLELKSQIEWIGVSNAIIAELKAIAYRQNCHRDTHCDVTFSAEVPGLTESNYLRSGPIPKWVNVWLLWASVILQFDCLYIGILRSKIPATYLTVKKHATLEPNGLEMYRAHPEQLVQAPVVNQIELPPLDLDMMSKPEIAQITLPPLLQENEMPFITDIRPPDFEVFSHDSKPAPANNVTGPVEETLATQYT